ncbi:Serine/threonine-protein kinase cbk1 [Cyphellophora attinorum]|uniref:Serine/threonine-protein kinase cbk1 n=1 Tax=Cyphellophora attinorum TaxID=1664694 RepID=A0A0N1H886_9EURO|nr:Serine/threonine-protein kinase cbk1 [Phialophora attinorum]KPI39482.1 Serine/threonine-protein kinase cbk1 [Phialophora attinorum]
MPFVNPLTRKRARSSSPQRKFRHVRPKAAPLTQVLYDGTASAASVDSDKDRLLAKNNFGTKVRNGFSSIIGLLSSEKKSDHGFTIESDGSAIAVTRTGLGAGLVHNSQSTGSVVVKKGSVLRLVGASYEEETAMPMTAPDTPQAYTDIGSSPSSMSMHSADYVHHRPSTPTLANKIQHRLQQTFSNHPTVVHRSNLRTRPSVHTLQTDSPEWMLSQVSSSPSAYTSGSGSSPKDPHKSTPATSNSEGSPATPTSVRHYEPIIIADNDQLITFGYDVNRPASRMSTIPESTAGPSLSVKTVEATAAAKVFFETHFNNMLNGFCPRDSREKSLMARMRELYVPSMLHEEAQKLLQKYESDNLRLRRVLKSHLPGKPNPIAVGGFEVVKVLGKGSFGVVRLVKEKAHLGSHL